MSESPWKYTGGQIDTTPDPEPAQEPVAPESAPPDTGWSAEYAKGNLAGRPTNLKGGGPVTKGTTPTADDVPAMLSKGEYVLPADTTAAVGVKNLDHLKESTHNPANRAGRSHGKRGFT